MAAPDPLHFRVHIPGRNSLLQELHQEVGPGRRDDKLPHTAHQLELREVIIPFHT